jgi:hypothetical protein
MRAPAVRMLLDFQGFYETQSAAVAAIIHHHIEADDFGARFEVTKGAAFGHAGRLLGRTGRLKQVLLTTQF